MQSLSGCFFFNMYFDYNYVRDKCGGSGRIVVMFCLMRTIIVYDTFFVFQRTAEIALIRIFPIRLSCFYRAYSKCVALVRC